MFSSRIHVLTVEREPTKFTNPDGTPRIRVSARCVLLSDNGEPVTVGRLRVPKNLEDKIYAGLFRASFSLGVPDFGDNKGDIVASVTELVEEKRTPLSKAS